LALLVFLQLNCKKEDFYNSKINVTEKFFELPKNADPIIKRIVEDLKQKNALHPFVEQFVKKEGYPAWNFAKIKIATPNPAANLTSSTEGDTLVTVPVALDGATYVKDLMYIKIDTEILYKLFIGENYAENGFDKDPNRTDPNADDIVKQIMAFEKEMFFASDSTVIYHIKDNRLFDYWPDDTTKPQDFYISYKISMPECPLYIHYVTWELCSSDKGPSSATNTAYVPKCPVYHTEVVFIPCFDESGGAWTSYPEGYPGGGGGDGTTPPPDSTTNPPNTLPDECGDERNWVIYVIDTNTGEWKNPCTQEPPPVGWPDGPGDDPCLEAQQASDAAKNLSQNQNFITAKNEIFEAFSIDGNEHVVSFGKDANGNIIRSAMNTGGTSSGVVPAINNRFADIHNHPNISLPSSGDIYGFIDNISSVPNYMRYIITSTGEIYALVAINQQAASIFNTQHPRVPAPPGTNFEPTFPIEIIDEMNEMEGWYGASEEMTLAFILAKYSTGIALLKKDINGSFKRLNTTETIDTNGVKHYSSNNCP